MSKPSSPKSEDHLHRNYVATGGEAVICGSISGILSRFATAPFDTVKIRLQLQVEAKNGKYSGLLKSMRLIVREEGIKALWKGNIPAEILYLCYGAVQFTCYSATNKQLNTLQQYYGFKLPESIQTFVTGAVAGSVSSLTTYPFDLLRTRFAAQGNGNKRIFTSLPQAIGIIYKAEGVSGFFKGVKPAVFAITPYMGLFFTSYEAMRRLFDNYPILPGTFSEPVSSIIATIVGKGVIFPLDVVRRRLQVQGIYRQYYLQEIPKYPSSIIQCLKQIIVYEGIRGLYKGFLVAIIKSAPASAISIWVYEESLRMLQAYKRYDTLI